MATATAHIPAQITSPHSDVDTHADNVTTSITFNEELSASLATQASLGEVLYRQGKYAESENILKDVLKQRITTLGQTHDNADVLSVMNTLAGVLKSQHRFAEAEHLLRQILDSDIRTLGADNMDTITSMANVSEILLLQGKNTKDAETFARKTVTMSQNLFGPDHPETALLMDNLANILAGSQKFDEAEKVSRDALHLRHKVLRKDHPLIGTSMNNLAAILSRAGKYKEAEDLHRQALKLCQDDAARFTATSNLAGVLEKQGRYKEAEDLYRTAVTLTDGVLRKDNQITQSVKRDLTDVLTKQGLYVDAERVLREI